MQYTIVNFFTMTCWRTSCCIFRAINQMLCRLACVIGMKLDACTRWHHLCMFSPKNKMPLTWRKHVGGWPQFFVHGEFPSTNGKTTPHNFEVWIIFNWQVCKCHMGWRQGCTLGVTFMYLFGSWANWTTFILVWSSMYFLMTMSYIQSQHVFSWLLCHWIYNKQWNLSLIYWQWQKFETCNITMANNALHYFFCERSANLLLFTYKKPMSMNSDCEASEQSLVSTNLSSATLIHMNHELLIE